MWPAGDTKAGHAVKIGRDVIMMRKILKKLGITAALCAAFAMAAAPVYADAVIGDKEGVITLGADLTDSEKSTVLALLGVDGDDLGDYVEINVTNAEEHKYLDSYLPSSVIGTRALSSCKVEEAASGTGVTVDVKNISYCTKEMYESALATAGMKDAKVVVAAPFEISGTAALVGTLKAYSEMTGTLISAEAIDSATQEIVTTSGLAESINDPEKASQLIAAAKQIIINNNIKNEGDIYNTIDELSVEFGVSLTDSEKQQIVDLLKKLSEMDIDVSGLMEQAPQIYEKIQDSGIDLAKYGITEKDMGGLLSIFKKFWDMLMSIIG